MYRGKNVGVKNLAREGSSNASGFECQSKKNTFIQVALKSLYFNVLYYRDIMFGTL